MSEFVTYIRLYTIIYNIQIKESGREENHIFLPLKLYTAVAVEYKPFFSPVYAESGAGR